MHAGIQISSLKPVLKTEEQVREAFRRVKEIGCDTVQLQWIDFAVPVEVIAEAMKENGIRSVSTQDFYQVVQENKDYFIRLNQLSGSQWVCVSRIPVHLRSRSGMQQYARELKEFAAELAEKGLRLCFHPTAPDYVLTEGIEPVAYLMEQLGDELSLCLDLYHLSRSGKSMVQTLHQYAGRVCMVHFKDSRRGADGTERLVPAGQGDIDWTGVVKACQDTGVSYGFVEQERWEKDPFECLAEAMCWLEQEILGQ